MRLGALSLVALVACGKSAPASKEVTGTFAIKGDAVTVTKCRPDRGANGVYVVLSTPKGALRFENKKLWWNGDDADGKHAGAALDCKKLDRSWGGGQRADGTAYFRGTLDFDCHDGPHTYVGTLTADCGNITAEERAQLDKQRTDMQTEQKKAAGDGSGSGAGSN